MTPFVKRRFKDNESMNSVNIKEALRAAMRGKGKKDIEDVARLVCLYLFLTLFFATTGNTIRWGYIPFVEDLDRMRDFAWVDAILESLISTIERVNSILRYNMKHNKIGVYFHFCEFHRQYLFCRRTASSVKFTK